MNGSQSLFRIKSPGCAFCKGVAKRTTDSHCYLDERENIGESLRRHSSMVTDRFSTESVVTWMRLAFWVSWLRNFSSLRTLNYQHKITIRWWRYEFATNSFFFCPIYGHLIFRAPKPQQWISHKSTQEWFAHIHFQKCIQFKMLRSNYSKCHCKSIDLVRWNGSIIFIS